MSERVYTYEGMFLFPQSESSNLRGVVEHVQDILDRADAEVLALSKWGERNLAYPIQKNKRGLYILAYFKAKGTAMTGIERDCNLSESLIRFIITRADHLTEEEILARDGREDLHAESTLRDEGDAPAEAEPVAAAAATEAADASDKPDAANDA